jgi:hypothetical protein
MNWDAIGAIAETLGAVGVIASLVYLAGQIRQNTAQMDRAERTARGDSYQSLLEMLQSTSESVRLDGEASEIIRRGLLDLRDLTEAEFFRFNWTMGGQLFAWDNALYQYHHGVLSEDRWVLIRNVIAHHAPSAGFRAWWKSYAHDTLSPEFVALVEEILGEEPDRGE